MSKEVDCLSMVKPDTASHLETCHVTLGVIRPQTYLDITCLLVLIFHLICNTGSSFRAYQTYCYLDT